jgi:hypothetical protein
MALTHVSLKLPPQLPAAILQQVHIRTTDRNYPLLSSLKFLSQNTTPLVTHF